MSYEFERLISAAKLPRTPSGTRKPAVLDSAGTAGSPPDSYTSADLALKTAASLHQWAETEDLAGEETMADRLQALLIGIADSDQNGELDDDELTVLEAVMNNAYDYLSNAGAADDDIDLLLNDWDSDAGDRIHTLLCESLPDGEEASADDIDDFALGNAQEAVFDAARGNYSKRAVVRGGKKTFAWKRMSGTVVLSAKQKVAIKKAQAKSHSSAAMARRLKSIKVRQKLGM